MRLATTKSERYSASIIAAIQATLTARTFAKSWGAATLLLCFSAYPQVAVSPLLIHVPVTPDSTAASASWTHDTVQRLVSEREGWYLVVDDGSQYDVEVVARKVSSAASDSTMWRTELIPGPESEFSKLPRQTKTFPDLQTAVPFLRLDLARLYITKNLRGLTSDQIPVDLKLVSKSESGGPLVEGQSIQFEFASPKSGYLNLINVNPSGGISLLYPVEGSGGRLDGGEKLRIPEPGIRYTVDEPFGEEYVKAIFTTIPLDLSFLGEPERSTTEDLDELLARVQMTRGSGFEIGTKDIRFETRPKE